MVDEARGLSQGGRMTLATDLCFWLARNRIRKRRLGDAGYTQHSFDTGAYRQWRMQALRQQFCGFFSAQDVIGKHVVDFGCGTGELSRLAAEMGASSVTGVELARELYEQAVRLASEMPAGVRPSFILAEDETRIPLPTQSADVILCFDVLEHVMAYKEIIREWRRVLRPQGRVLIWWVPWWHPYGPHIESLVPVPWAHVFFSDRTLIETCARVYDSPDFQPRIWDLDTAGQKRPNKWRAMQVLPGVNRLTMRRFEKLCGQTGLKIESRRLVGFRSSSLARLTWFFLRVPYLREFFTATAVYVLRNPEN